MKMILDGVMTGLGILGVALLGLDVLLESTNKLGGDHKLFTKIYVIANFLLFVYSLYSRFWLFVVLNGILLIVGIYAFYRSHFGGKKRRMVS